MVICIWCIYFLEPRKLLEIFPFPMFLFFQSLGDLILQYLGDIGTPVS